MQSDMVVSIIDGEYQFNDLENLILNQYTNPFVYSTSRDVWGGIVDSAIGLGGKVRAQYLRSAYLYLSAIRSDVKEDISLRREVNEMLNIEGIALQHDSSLKENEELQLKNILEKSGIMYSERELRTLKKSISDLKDAIGNSSELLLSKITEDQKKMYTLFKTLEMNAKDKNLLNKKSFMDLSQVIDNLSKDIKAASSKELESYKSAIFKFTDFGLNWILGITDMQKARMLAMEYLRENKIKINITGNNLHRLPVKYHKGVCDYVKLIFGNDPKVKNICDNLFRSPRIRLQSNEESRLASKIYGLNIDDY